MKIIRAILFSFACTSTTVLAGIHMQVDGRVIKKNKSQIIIKSKEKTYTIRFSEIESKEKKKQVKKAVVGKKVSFSFPITQKFTVRQNEPRKSQER